MRKKAPGSDDSVTRQRSSRRFTAVDLFAGCGGLSSGLLAAGFNVLAAIEKDADAAASYRANHPIVKLYEKDIRKVLPWRLLRALNLPKGETLDLVAGCPPCQGFTRLTENSGRRDRRNGLIRQYLRFVRALQPKVCMLENVPGLAKTDKGKRYFNELRRGLRAAGYKVSYEVVELADYGVPQFRKRLVLLAARDQAIPIPTATHRNPNRPGRSGQRPWKTVRDAIAALPDPPLRSAVRSGDAVTTYKWHFARDVASVVRRRLKHALKHGRYRASFPKSLRLPCHERRPDGYYDVYGVLDWKMPSATMTSGCTNASKGRFGHPSQPRPLTATEAAMLQTFPLSYKFEGSGLESVAAQIGNALPRRFAKVIGRAIIKRLKVAAPPGRLERNGRRKSHRCESTESRADSPRARSGIAAYLRTPQP